MKRIFFLLFVSLCFKGRILSQESKDAGLWATVGIEKKINKKFSLFIIEEYRQRENFTRPNLLYTQPGISFRPYDFLKISLAYRFIDKYLKDNSISFRHRLLLDITLKKKFGRFGLSFRERIQAENRNILSSESGKVPEWYSRNKLEVKYDIDKPITPYVSIELRYQIRNPRAIESDKMWSRNRYAFGLDYKRSDKHSFGLYYLIQQEYNVSAPQNLFIVGLEYSLSL